MEGKDSSLDIYNEINEMSREHWDIMSERGSIPRGEGKVFLQAYGSLREEY